MQLEDFQTSIPCRESCTFALSLIIGQCGGIEQITKADRLRVSRPLQKGKSRATLRRLSSTVLRS